MSIISKTLGGLSKQYYIRQFLFGCIFAAVLIFTAISSYSSRPDASTLQMLTTILMAVFLTFLYPYSRFVYESIVDYIVGENVFFVNAIMMILVKIITMVVCWSFSIFIAPVGMIYLYFYHSKKEREYTADQQ